MKVLINAVSLKQGGSSVVLEKLLISMQGMRPDIEWIVASHPDLAESLRKKLKGTLLPTEYKSQSVRHFLEWYLYGLPAAVRHWRPDVLFSQTSYLPWRRIPCPTLLLEQHAGHYCSDFDLLVKRNRRSLLGRALWVQEKIWARKSADTATLLTVQTEALANLIATRTRKRREQIRVIPHGPGLVEHVCSRLPRHDRDRWRIGYVANYGVQKNFATLFHAIRLLADAGRKIKLVVTLDSSLQPVKSLLKLATEMGIASLIENWEIVSGHLITGLYDGLDIFVFPSTCESFGLPMVEAMARGLPIIVANTPENREVAGQKAPTFPSHNGEALATALACLMDGSDLWQEQAKRSLERSRKFSWDIAAAGTIAALEEAAQAGP